MEFHERSGVSQSLPCLSSCSLYIPICFQFVFRVSVCLCGSTLSSLPFSKAATSVGVAEKKAMRKGFSVFSKGAKASAWGSQRVTQWGTQGRGDLGPELFGIWNLMKLQRIHERIHENPRWAFNLGCSTRFSSQTPSLKTWRAKVWAKKKRNDEKPTPPYFWKWKIKVQKIKLSVSGVCWKLKIKMAQEMKAAVLSVCSKKTLKL